MSDKNKFLIGVVVLCLVVVSVVLFNSYKREKENSMELTKIIQEKESEIKKLKDENKKLVNDYNNLVDEYEKLVEKYNTEIIAIKRLKSEYENLEKDVKVLKERLKKGY